MNYFLKTDYHNRPLRVLDVAELQFPSIAWKAKKGNVKDGIARWRAVSEVLCYRADSPHPYTGLRAHSAPSLQRRPRTEGREVEVTPLKERRERQREGEHSKHIYSISYILFTTWNHVLKTLLEAKETCTKRLDDVTLIQYGYFASSYFFCCLFF